MKLRSKLFSSHNVRIFYFGVCFLFVICIGGIRSAPVYGKLDFLLLNSKPWWPEWRPMISDILKKKKQPVLTDPITSAVLSGVFGQKTVFFRRFSHQPFFYVERVDQLNTPLMKMLPAGALVLLLKDKLQSETSVKKVIMDSVFKTVKMGGKVSVSLGREHPYRCLINVHGFTPTWVSSETQHWRPSLANTLLFYSYNNRRGSRLLTELHEKPPENCDVFF